MAKFNKTKPSSLEKQETVNLAGGDAYRMNPKTELVTFLLTKFLSDQFYESEKDQLSRLVKFFKPTNAILKGYIGTTRHRADEIIQDINDGSEDNALFIAKACLYARNTIGMRSITHAMAGEIALNIKAQPWLSKFFDKIVRRPDDMMEIASYVFSNSSYTVTQCEENKPIILTRNKKKLLQNCLKRGFSKAFNRFNDYQLSKYAQTTREIKLVDIVNLVHPKPNDKNKASLEELVKTGTIKNLTTTQRALTDIGQNKQKEDQDAYRTIYWADSLRQKKLGYLDLLRSLTKIIKECPQCIDLACEQLTNRESVKKSLVMPYQVWFAIKRIRQDFGFFGMVKENPMTLVTNALYTALQYSMDNIPELPGRTLVVCDYSGSMDRSFNESASSYKEIGTLMGALLCKKVGADFMIFGSNAAYVPLNNQDTIETIINHAMKCNQDRHNKEFPYVDHGTNFSSIFNGWGTVDFQRNLYAPLREKYDRVVIFSDMQGWGLCGGGNFLQAYKEYCKFHGSFMQDGSIIKEDYKPYMYMFDLAGHGSSMLPDSKTFVLSGFSDKVFKLMTFLEKGEDALINEIEKVAL